MRIDWAAAAIGIAAALATPALAAEPLPAVSSDATQWKIAYDNGLQLSRTDGNAKFKIGGRIQADFAVIDVDNALETAVPGGDGVGVEFRRARFYMSGELYKRILWKSQIDFASGNVSIKDMYVGMKGLGFLGTARVGHQKEPYSLEELTSTNNITFMERSLASVFDSERNTGLNFSNALCDERMTWSAGIYAPTDSTGSFFNHDPEFNVSARVTGLPIYSAGGRHLLHLGLAGSYQKRDDSDVQFRRRPEMNLAKHYIDTGPTLSDGNALLGIELAAVAGPLWLASEWKQGWIDTPTSGTGSLYGGYVMAGYFLTGEHRPYNTSKAAWTRVHPLAPFDPAKGQWGAVEIATRYSYLDANDEAVRGGREQNVDVAVNWYLFSSVRVSWNYVHADVKDTGDFLKNASGKINGFQTRVQIAF